MTKYWFSLYPNTTPCLTISFLYLKQPHIPPYLSFQPQPTSTNCKIYKLQNETHCTRSRKSFNFPKQSVRVFLHPIPWTTMNWKMLNLVYICSKALLQHWIQVQKCIQTASTDTPDNRIPRKLQNYQLCPSNKIFTNFLVYIYIKWEKVLKNNKTLQSMYN